MPLRKKIDKPIINLTKTQRKTELNKIVINPLPATLIKNVNLLNNMPEYVFLEERQEEIVENFEK